MQLIVYERDGAWADALRRASRTWRPGALAAVRETRSLVECEEALATAPSALVVVVLSEETLDSAVAFVDRTRQNFSRGAVVVVTPPGLVHYRQLLTEAGAIATVTSLGEAWRIAALAERRAAREPAPKQSLAEQVWSELPWSAR